MVTTDMTQMPQLLDRLLQALSYFAISAFYFQQVLGVKHSH